MDINTVKVIRNGLNSKENENNKMKDKKQDKKSDIKGCLKLADYMAF